VGSETGKKRIVNYDLLRILAAFSVVMLHSAAQFWYTLDIYGTEWLIANSYDALFRFGVPIFVMISGALLLRPDYELDLKRLYRHNILRLLVIYIVWSCLYGLMDCLLHPYVLDWKGVIRQLISGRYHLWFLPMLIGIYMLLPILKGWLAHTDKKGVQYFLGLFFVLQICRETLRALTVTDELHYVLDIVDVELVCGYVGYFVWGYYLSQIKIGKKLQRFFYMATIPSLLCNVLLGNWLAHRAGMAVGTIYDSFGLFTFVQVTALFLFVQERFGENSVKEKTGRLVGQISADTFGVYVLHIGLIELLERVGIHSMMLPNLIGIPVHAVLIFVLALILAALLRRIPVIGRYLC